MRNYNNKMLAGKHVQWIKQKRTLLSRVNYVIVELNTHNA